MKSIKIDYIVKAIITKIVVFINNLSFLCLKKVIRIKDKYAWKSLYLEFNKFKNLIEK